MESTQRERSLVLYCNPLPNEEAVVDSEGRVEELEAVNHVTKNKEGAASLLV